MGDSVVVNHVPHHVPVPDEWNAVTERIIACAMEVHSVLGPGFAERQYEDAMMYELTAHGLAAARQAPVRVRYKAIDLSEQRLDLVVESLVVVELKAVDRVHDVHLAQLVSYLRSADLPLGLLLNFNEARLVKGVYRRINPRCTRFPPRDSAPSLRSSGPSGSSAF
jgi:GxxExxY protein